MAKSSQGNEDAIALLTVEMAGQGCSKAMITCLLPGQELEGVETHFCGRLT